MFNNTTFFVLIKTNNSREIKRLILTRETQNEICRLFSESAEELISSNEFIIFDGSYKPDKGEIQFIEDYSLDSRILNALREPTSIDPFIPDEQNPQDIKVVFTGVIEPEIKIAFQKLNKSQLLHKKGINLFHNSNTFDKVSKFGININDKLDCLYIINRLFFSSYHDARQVFDLVDYYRTATDCDLDQFVNCGLVHTDDPCNFKSLADSYIRRKIAMINDSGVLNDNTPHQIAEKAASYEVSIQIVNDQINLPTDKKELKKVLKFLDEEIYKGPFSDSTYETNSKRLLTVR